jgi:hypothetical protein
MQLQYFLQRTFPLVVNANCDIYIFSPSGEFLEICYYYVAMSPNSVTATLPGAVVGCSVTGGASIASRPAGAGGGNAGISLAVVPIFCQWFE